MIPLVANGPNYYVLVTNIHVLLIVDVLSSAMLSRLL